MLLTNDSGDGSQTALAATARDIEYIIHFSGCQFLVHRRVPYLQTGLYYLESSDLMEIDSVDTPCMAVLIAIALTAKGILAPPRTLDPAHIDPPLPPQFNLNPLPNDASE
jgi:hypothetical protein